MESACLQRPRHLGAWAKEHVKTAAPPPPVILALGASEFPNLYLQPKLYPDFERSYPDTLGYIDILQAKLISGLNFSLAELET